MKKNGIAYTDPQPDHYRCESCHVRGWLRKDSLIVANKPRKDSLIVANKPLKKLLVKRAVLEVWMARN